MVEILEKLLEKEKPTKFTKTWLDNSLINESSVNQVYTLLREYGFSDEIVSKNAHWLTLEPASVKKHYNFLRKEIGLTEKEISSRDELIGRNTEEFRKTYNLLRKKGLTKEKIRKNAHLLTLSNESIKERYRNLTKKKITKKSINTNAHLLGNSPETINKRYDNLKKKGLSYKKIVAQPTLLVMPEKTINFRYQNLRRFFEKELITKFSTLLTLNDKTIESTIQHLCSAELNYDTYKLLLYTKPQTKRKKLAWMLREIFDYRTSDDKIKTIRQMYEFVREYPGYLIKSVERLEKEKDNLRKKVEGYFGK